MRVNYRKIWEEFSGKQIPEGYHIHHLDGDRDNNDPSNLVCLSPAEHWDLHYKQGDIRCLSGKFVQGASEAGRKGGSKNKGVPKSKEAIAKTTEGILQAYAKNGDSKLKGRPISDEHRENIRKANIGEGNPMFGKSHTEESIKAMSAAASQRIGDRNSMYGKTQSEDAKKLISDSKKGKNWYTNGIDSKFCKECPDGWRKGRASCKRK